MKKSLILSAFILVSVLNFTSCSSEDVSSPTAATDELVGKWNFSKFSTSFNGVTTPELDYDDNEPGCPKDYLEFKTGGVFNNGEYSGSTCVLDSESGTWTQSGSTITITEGTDVFTAQLVSVTSSELKLKVTETDNGITITVNLTFTKA